MEHTKYWIIVASQDHVELGVKEGISQACHGKSGPLARMRPGDWVIYYSPKTRFKGGEPCQSFTAIGRIKSGNIYQTDMGDGFRPFRRDVEFFKNNPVPIRPLVHGLSFIKNKKSWGYMFRFGFFEIPQQDFDLISSGMLVSNKEAVFEC